MWGGAQAQYSYTTNFPDTNTITITKYTGSGGTVVVPTNILGKTVTSVGDYAFRMCANLADITIPNSVTNIGVFAFYYCTALNSVTIPNSVTKVGYYAFYCCANLTNIFIGNGVTDIGISAFYSCTSLTSITIPDSITNIGSAAFAACSNLTSIAVNQSNPTFSSADGVLFNKDRTMLIQYPGGMAGSYTIPDSVTTIADDTFNGCAHLTSVTIGNAVTSIGHDAFQDCVALTTVAIPNSVTTIGGEAFQRCANLTNVTIGNAVTNIGDDTFETCTSLEGAYFKGNPPTVGSYVFRSDTNIVYYLPGTTNWGSTFGGRPTAVWKPLMSADASSGIQSNQFGFDIHWASGMVCVVEACTDLTAASWAPLQTNALPADSSHFSDPDWPDHPQRFYRIRWQ